MIDVNGTGRAVLHEGAQSPVCCKPSTDPFHLLDAASRSRDDPDLLHVVAPAVPRTEDSTYASDGFHPGPGGYRLWGEHLAEVLIVLPAESALRILVVRPAVCQDRGGEVVRHRDPWS